MQLEAVKNMLWVFTSEGQKNLSPSTTMQFIIPALYAAKEVGPEAIDLLIKETDFTEETLGQANNQQHGAIIAKVHDRTPPLKGDRSRIPSTLIVSNIPTAIELIDLGTLFDKVSLPPTNLDFTVKAEDLDVTNHMALVSHLNENMYPKHVMLLGPGAVNKFSTLAIGKLSFIYDEIWLVL